MSRRRVAPQSRQGATLRNWSEFVAVLDASKLADRALARAAGLSHSTVNHLVTGRRKSCTVGTAAAIEDALGCARGSLFEVRVPA